MSLKPLYQLLLQLVTDTYQTAINLFKIMIPVSILVKLLEYFDLIQYIGKALSPLMRCIGLPGEMGLVWATTMITNIYGGMLTYFTLLAHHHYSTAQITIMCALMLVAHTLPVELRVAQKAGVNFVAMFLIRFLFAFFSGFLLHALYSLTGTLQEEAILTTQLIKPITDTSLSGWLLGEAERYAKITLYIFALISFMKLLHAIGFIKLLANSLKPILGILGISKAVIPITVIGSTLGILYGGALIIKASEEQQLPKMEVFYAMTLMGLCHSLIEDSILMMSLGAHYSGVFLFRMIFAFTCTFLIVKITKALPKKWCEKFLVN
jgi:hypothetical protein